MLEKYIRKILQEIHPNMKIARKSLIIIEKIMINFLKKLILKHIKLKNFDLSIRELMEETLANKTINYEFLKDYNNLSYSPYIIYKIIKMEGLYMEYFKNESVLQYLSIIIEYITFEILSLSKIITNNNNKIIIHPYYIYEAISKSNELSNLIINIFDMPISNIVFA